ncbi:oxidoreductase [Thermoclostridium stercorarium subsp. thermolacticum DSM 2910]|uniref:Oxidoreductase n=1 Tax=Thermoclostridium stercorarium subsp. thermolacticum DSM 2910 TaxID=1121336 RepID=A0A1B1Y9Y2_THEST|nr:Gfo/Idh/MocA family oxidoreductase [Thermoclostridium stercorarium]ANW97564.1 oxidoreductase [Thermoclostridium stercorarium subsp. thermolacticum DSM 2910]
MERSVSVVVVGIGGFGYSYLKGIFHNGDRCKINIAGVVEPYPENCACIAEIKNRNIPVFRSLQEFYSSSFADFAVIVSPIQFHSDQVCYALEMGSHVLCEKPISATVQDARKMMKARDKSGKILAIGYQWSFSDEIQQLKKDILSGLYGRPKRLKTIVLWSRGVKYYSRSWAGKLRDASGRWILDSIANNAAAHYLHNMFFVTGKSKYISAVPKTVQAELYRANDIENFDTVAARIFTDDNTEMMFFASHAHAAEGKILKFCYEFTEGTIYYSDERGNISFEARLKNGSVIRYNNPSLDSYSKFCRFIEQVGNNEPVSCGPEAAYSHILCVNGMQESMPGIVTFPDNLIKREKLSDGDEVIFVEGLENTLTECYELWKLPSEKGIAWAKAGKEINLTGYSFFPAQTL